MILAGDIGGTKTYLGRFDFVAGRPLPLEVQCFRTLSYPGLEPMIREFLDGRHQVEVAAFGIPGPVVDRRVHVTNVPWTLDADSLACDLNIQSVQLVNDLVATGYGTQVLPSASIVTLNDGLLLEDQTEALIAAGTGLGECVLQWSAGKRVVLPCEAGHSAFAPHNRLQTELLQFLMRRMPYVCVERVLSGPGLISIYEFLRDTGRAGEDRLVAEAMREGDPAAVIATEAEAERDELCCRAMEVFVTAYGSEAGNLAVRTMSLGGIYVGGGIAPKIIKALKRGGFMTAFAEKERMEEMLARVPVRVILDDQTGLTGAAYVAWQTNLSTR